MRWIDILPFVVFAIAFAAIWLMTHHLAPAVVHLLHRSASWVAGRALRPKLIERLGERIERWRLFLPVALILAVGLFVSWLAGDAFLELVELLQTNSGRLEELDRAIHSAAVDYRSGATTRLFTLATIVGTPVGLGIIAVIVAAWFAVKGHWRWSIYLLTTATGGGVLNLALKSYFARARPELSEALRSAHGYSFPSGHAMGSVVVFGALAYLAFRSFTSWRARSFTISLAITAIVTISLSRIYLGVHWVSDIAAGIAAGTLWVATTTTAYETFRRIRRVREIRGAGEGVRIED